MLRLDFSWDTGFNLDPGYLRYLLPALSLGARGEGILDGGGRVERVSGFRDRLKKE